MKLFPYIHNIDDVLPHIKTFDEFVVAERDGFTWIDYVIEVSGQTFDRKYDGWEYRRECRGLFFDKKGAIISRPVHKVFNVNQLEETLAHNIKWEDIMFIEEKRDGSMIRPFILEGEIRWATRKGITEVAIQVENFVKENEKYDFFVRELCENNITPLFEWTSPTNRIVVNYEKEELTLLLARENFSGNYIPIRSHSLPR